MRRVYPIPGDYALPDVGLDVEWLPASRLRTVRFDTLDRRLDKWGFSVQLQNNQWVVDLPNPSAHHLLVQTTRVRTLDSGDGMPRQILDLVQVCTGTQTLAAVDHCDLFRRTARVTGEELDQVCRLEIDVDLAAADDGLLTIELPPSAEPGFLSDVEEWLGIVHHAASAETASADDPRDRIRWDLQRSLKRFVEHMPGVVLADDAEAVHQARVAVRRIRSTLKTFQSCFDCDWANGMRLRAKPIARSLGRLRDADVLAARFGSTIAEWDASAAASGMDLIDELNQEREQHRDGVIRMIRSGSFAAATESLVDGIDDPQWSRKVPGLAKSVSRKWSKVQGLYDSSDGSPEHLHRLRIAVKEVRYASELAAGSDIQSAYLVGAGAAEKLQEVLGGYQDSVMASQRLQELTGASRVVSALEAIEDDRRSQILWQPVWEELVDAMKPFESR